MNVLSSFIDQSSLAGSQSLPLSGSSRWRPVGVASAVMSTNHRAPCLFHSALQRCVLVPVQDLRQYLSNLAERCNSAETDTELPAVVVLDNLHHISSLSDIFNGFLNCKYHKW